MAEGNYTASSVVQGLHGTYLFVIMLGRILAHSAGGLSCKTYFLIFLLHYMVVLSFTKCVRVSSRVDVVSGTFLIYLVFFIVTCQRLGLISSASNIWK